ncbi:hypothetical protein N7520_000582 [Penicillium odoratum]|uniref:uncharacterized protein n=1 Tax=Penicillium odoratum TaxID=1167516 RepID=UPI0025476366|nr:uncharacterized protein N7520_000582 [Penicillium odoratum]KAJ5777336.1 hypothetical protein N7520_000582 [Penicillium odoratum]
MDDEEWLDIGILPFVVIFNIYTDLSWCPSDEQNLRAWKHDSETPNALFSAPTKSPKSLLFILTIILPSTFLTSAQDNGIGPSTVRGVDLYPPPIIWVPPNCILEVDNILEERTWREPFDLIHLSNMVASFSPQEWDTVYEQCGCWIEQLEGDAVVRCDDDSFQKINLRSKPSQRYVKIRSSRRYAKYDAGSNR